MPPLRKAPTLGCVPIEVHLLPDPIMMVEQLQMVINKALIESTFPTWWKDVAVTLLTKKPLNTSNQT